MVVTGMETKTEIANLVSKLIADSGTTAKQVVKICNASCGSPGEQISASSVTRVQRENGGYDAIRKVGSAMARVDFSSADFPNVADVNVAEARQRKLKGALRVYELLKRRRGALPPEIVVAIVRELLEHVVPPSDVANKERPRVNYKDLLVAAQRATFGGVGEEDFRRVLRAMEEKNLVSKLGDPPAYGPGDLMHPNRLLLKKHREVIEQVTPLLSVLANLLNGVSHLATLSGSEVVYLARQEGGRAGAHPVAVTYPGASQPYLHASALGKALLSGLSAEDFNRVLAGYTYKPFTASTKVSRELLEEGIDSYRSSGVFRDKGEIREGLQCFGTLIPGRTDLAISVSIENQDFLDEKRVSDVVSNAAKDAADAISKSYAE